MKNAGVKRIIYIAAASALSVATTAAITAAVIRAGGGVWGLAVFLVAAAAVTFGVLASVIPPAASIVAPISLIKQKLDSVGKSGDGRITLTSSDEINRVLIEIDEISERLSANLAGLDKEKAKLAFVLENLNLAVLVIGADGGVVLSNGIAKEYFGFGADGVSADKAVRNIALLDSVRGAATEKKFATFDMPYKRAEILEIKLLPVRSNEISLIVTAQNVTDVRNLEKEKRDFFVNASHELNTPLAAIAGYAEILKKEKKYNPEFIDTVLTQAERMKSLLADMLRLAELEEGGGFPDGRVNLKTAAREVIAAYAPKAAEKNIDLTADTDDITIAADKEKITEVMSNLVDNAIKYTDGGGAVSLTVKASGGDAVLTVKDNGIGIAAEHLNRVCERFYRVDKGRGRAAGGTGLGLAIVKHICSRYNAPLSIVSEESLGTQVTVRFPAG